MTHTDNRTPNTESVTIAFKNSQGKKAIRQGRHYSRAGTFTQFVTESQKTKSIVLYYKWGMGENGLRAMWNFLQSSYILYWEFVFLFLCI